MTKYSRDYEFKTALCDSVNMNGHCIISVTNVSTNKRKNIQKYELLLNGYIPHDDLRTEFRSDFEFYNTANANSYVKLMDVRTVQNTYDNPYGSNHYVNILCTVDVKYIQGCKYRPYPIFL
jgi:hypothetical protein